MELLGGSIALLIYIIIIVLAFKLLKNVVKTVFIALILIGILLVGTSYFIYKDVQDIRENFPDQLKTVILGDGEKILAGFSAIDIMSDDINYMTMVEAREKSGSYGDEDYNELLGLNYKILIFDLDMFKDEIEKGIEIQKIGKTPVLLKGSKLNETLYSDDPLIGLLDVMVDKMLEEHLLTIPDSENMPLEIKDQIKEEVYKQVRNELSNIRPGQIKAMLLALLIKEKAGSQGVTFIFDDFKDEKLLVYPETAVFKALKFMPKKFVNSTFSKLKI